MTIKDNFPIIRPTLELDFANERALDSRVTFTRASTGTYYDGQTSAVAEQNLLPTSQQFTGTGTYWIPGDVSVTANTIVAPDTTNTASTILATGANSTLRQLFPADGSNFTFSIWLQRKTGTGNIQINAGSTYTTVAVSNTMTRFSITQAPSSGLRTCGIFVNTIGDEVYVWGSQLENRSANTAYTTTTTTAITNSIPVLMTAQLGIPRFNNDPNTQESLGLLVEQQSTNLFTYSSAFDNAAWVVPGAGAITANQNIAPDGTQSADLFYDLNTTNNFRLIGIDGLSIPSGTSYTMSVYVKAYGNNFSYIRVGQSSTNNNIIVYFNLSTGVVGTSTRFANTNSPTIISSLITPVGDSWYRVVVAFTANTTGSHYCQIGMSTADNTFGHIGNGYSGIYIWGAQLEALPFSTSYIPTVASQATRNADFASITGTNFSSWYGHGQGTVYCEYNCGTTNTYQGSVFSLNDGTSSNKIDYRAGAPAGYFYAQTTGAYIGPTASSTITFIKFGMSWTIPNYTATKTSSSPVTLSNVYVPPLNTLFLGNVDYSNAQMLNGHIKKFSYYPVQFTNTQLQTLIT